MFRQIEWTFVISTRCGPYFGSAVEAVQCLTYQTEWSVQTCKKEAKHTLVLGCAGERISLHCRQVTSRVPKTMKNLCVLQFCSWDGSFRHGKMKIWVCSYFQHVTRYIGTDFVEESRQKMQRSEKENFFREKCFDQMQRINAVHGRYSISGVLRDIPSNFTPSVRRQIVLLCLSSERWNRYVAMAECSEQMDWRTGASALSIRDFSQIAYFLPMWGGIWSGVVFLWRSLICPQNSSLRMFWYRDLNSSHFFPRFGALEHEANRIPDISAAFFGSRKKFHKRNRRPVCPAEKGKPSILSVSYRLNRFNRCSRGRTTLFRILCQNLARTVVCSWFLHTRNALFHKRIRKSASMISKTLLL